ncbi:hypothetical protein NEHOM01_0490 [Nematocida homosporus]|uniref:uncharacterized protein n=1 Tax=Nematocida homosporus TaxID=1912981 RepID=UPI002220A787|nr:uncharacterized protein NEHOM01_0490 [Nematocida homosporus]KAI5184939.1 hypothetical protein NEHOM01_0490 [Nematocida homosporus]
MQSFTISHLRMLIGALKNGSSPSSTAEDLLLQYTKSDQTILLLFQAVKEEDQLGQFYALLTLQKTLQTPDRLSEPSLDLFINQVEELLFCCLDSDRLVSVRLAALYATLGLLYWPVKPSGFISRIKDLISRGQPIGAEVLGQFLAQAVDSLEITEERRYELKKALHGPADDLFGLVANQCTTETALSILVWLARLGSASAVALEAFFSTKPAFSGLVAELISEISVPANSQLFRVISAYLLTAYDLKPSAGLVVACASLGNRALPKCMQKGAFDDLLRQILSEVSTGSLGVVGLVGVEGESLSLDTSAAEEEGVGAAAVLDLLKVFAARARGFLLRVEETQESIAMVLGGKPGEFFIALSNLGLKIGAGANDTIARTVDLLAESLPYLATDILLRFHTELPIPVAEVLIKRALVPAPLTSPYLRLKQALVRGEDQEAALSSASLSTAKECAAARECLLAMSAAGTLTPALLQAVYQRAVSGPSHAMDLAVSAAVLMNRPDLVALTMKDFQAGGLAALVAAAQRCPGLLTEVFPRFITYLTSQSGEMIGVIDTAAKVLEAIGGDAEQVLGMPALQCIYARISSGSLSEVRKITKLLARLSGSAQHAFIREIWSRLRAEEENNDGIVSSEMQRIAVVVASACSPETAGVLWEMASTGACPVRSLLVGIKEVLKQSSTEEIQQAALSTLVSLYTEHSEESLRASIAGLLSEQPERIQRLEMMYGISLQDVQAATEKRAAMKRALRRIEGLREKAGALFQRVQAPEAVEDPRWSQTG